jgi:hypothetical protein
VIWKDYSKLPEQHALCGGSNYSWRNKTPEQIVEFKMNSYAVKIGTILHEYAKKNITRGFKMSKQDKHSVLRYLTIENDIPEKAIDLDRIFITLMNYVNDSITLKMSPEIRLYYSDNFNGTADAISFEKGSLKIFDLKTGVTSASFMQLENYAAFFCLDYNISPKEIKDIEYRIYQNMEMAIINPDPLSLLPILNHIIETEKMLRSVF